MFKSHRSIRPAAPVFSRRRAAAALAIPWLAGALLGCGGSEPPPNVQRVIVFGDSLSDLGTYKKRSVALGEPSGGKFTVNPGPLWVENVASYYGTTIGLNRTAGFGSAPTLEGGTGYAEGGSRVAEQPGSNNTDATMGPNSGASTLPVKDQITAHLQQKGAFNASDLVLVWVGTNDVFRPIGIAPVAPEVGVPQVQKAADDLAKELARLKANGALKIAVLNLDDLGKAPIVAFSSAAQSYATALSAAFNARLATHVNGLGGVVLVDIQGLFSDVRTNPSKYGLSNLTGTACLPRTDISSYSAVCTKSTLVAPNANNTYLYADTVHYTDKTNQIISDYVIGKVSPLFPK
ncbi:MAG: SGNH/GDSL hydrolase family protein [Burkholderiaceae bacterium]|nr:SGNH/GDSL hydrolase family protein [Burkholderiaceae bacterium]